MTREEARNILESMTKGDSLLRHARSVELVMEAYGKQYDTDVFTSRHKKIPNLLK